MLIHWINKNKKAAVGDYKISHSGERFIRAYFVLNGNYVLSRGFKVLRWYDYDSPTVSDLAKQISSGKIKHSTVS